MHFMSGYIHSIYQTLQDILKPKLHGNTCPHCNWNTSGLTRLCLETVWLDMRSQPTLKLHLYDSLKKDEVQKMFQRIYKLTAAKQSAV